MSAISVRSGKMPAEEKTVLSSLEKIFFFAQ
jgi:hypothetical protein